jgi:hypothetical protein
MTMKRIIFAIACLLFALSGCGGGSSYSAPTPAPIGDSFTSSTFGLTSSASEDASALDISSYAETQPEDADPVNLPV